MQKMPNPHSRTVANFLGCVLITLVVAATTVSFPRLVLGDVLWSCWPLAFSVGLLSDPMVTQLCLPSSRSAFFEFRSVSSWCEKIRERDEVVQWEGEDTSRARREKRIVLGAFKKKERENSTPLDDLRRSSLQRGHAGGVQPQISESLVQDFITTFASLFLPAAPPLYLMRSLQHSFSRNCL